MLNNIQDALITNDTNLDVLRKRIVLLSNFTNNNRSMQQLFRDSITIVRYFDKLFIFVIFIVNLA